MGGKGGLLGEALRTGLALSTFHPSPADDATVLVVSWMALAALVPASAS